MDEVIKERKVGYEAKCIIKDKKNQIFVLTFSKFFKFINLVDWYHGTQYVSHKPAHRIFAHSDIEILLNFIEKFTFSFPNDFDPQLLSQSH